MSRVVVLGDVMVDVLARLSGPVAIGSDSTARIAWGFGGSAANVAAWLVTAGVERPALVGRVGADPRGAAAAEELAAAGVDARLAVDEQRPTGTCIVLVAPGGERSMLPDAGANDRLHPDDLRPELFRPGRHLHLSGYTLLRDGSRDAGLRALAQALEVGMSVSVDPSSEALLVGSGAARFLEATRGVHLLLPNTDEARCLTGERSPSRAAEALASTYGEVVVKLGGDGALWQRGFITASAAAERRAEVVDTTGAGDAFAAGFLATWLLHPEPESALAAGNRLAARAIGHVGARP